MFTRKFTIHYLVLLAFCLILSACGNLQPVSETSGQADLVANLELPDTLPANGPVTLKFTLQNQSDKSLYLLKWYTPLEGIAGEIFRVERNGELVPYEGILAMRAAPGSKSYVHLDPGESVSAEVDLSEAYDFSKSGKYTVEFLSPNISHIAYSESEMAKSVDELYPVKISSNEVNVEIVENSSNGSSFAISVDDALVMIEEYLRGQPSDPTKDLDLDLEELTPDYIWESLHVQIFRVIEGEAFLHETFLISEERVLKMGTAAGGRGITSMLISDMDKDGESELLFTFSFDSGTYQSRIGMYAPGLNKNQIFEPAYAYLGDLGLTIQEDGSIAVRIVEADEATLRLKYLDTFGNLSLGEQEDGLVMTFRFDDNLSDEIKSKLAFVHATGDLVFFNDTPQGDQLDLVAVPLGDKNKLVASLELPDTLPANKPVTLKFTLQNRSTEALYFLKWYTPLEGISGKIFRVKRDGQLVPYEGILAMRAAPGSESYVHLDPGESVSAEVDLTNAYDFSQPGKYTIAFLSPSISHIAYSEAEMAESVDDLYPVDISSNEVSVEIVESSSSGSPFSLSAEQALVMIEDYLRGQQPDLTEELDLEIEELTPDYVWESLQVQIFQVIEGEAFNNEMFLLSEDQVLRLGKADGGRGVTSMLISDMDKDGVDELLFTFSFDSGTYQSRIGMYAPGYNEYQILEPTIAYLGDLGLTIQEDGIVDVKVVDADEENLKLKYLDTLGNLALRKESDVLILGLKLKDNFPEEIKNKLVTGRVTSDCQVWDTVQLDAENADESSPEEIAASLWTKYLEQFQSPISMDRCKLISFAIDNVTLDPEEGQRILVGPEEYLALIDYAVQVEHKEGTIWMAGSGREIESSDEGWIGKTVLVKVTKKDKVYILTIQGFG